MTSSLQNVRPDWRTGWAAGLVVGGAIAMMPHGGLHDYGTVPLFLAGAAVMLAGYFLALGAGIRDVRMIAIVAVLARVILLIQIPGDDIYRYIWEGTILAAGWNPYLHAPDSPALEAMRGGVWEAVQHKSFTAIYPPLAECVFAAMSRITSSPLAFKVVFLVADLAVAWILGRRFGAGRAVVYAWNPLIIYSFAGGGHYDSLFLLAMVMGWTAWIDGRRTAAVAWLGAAVALKWIALPLLAWAGWRILMEAVKSREWRAAAAAAAAGLAPLLISYVLIGLWTGEWTTHLHPAKFSQYARSAEFVPGIVGWFWEESKVHNQWFLLPLALAWGWIILRGREIARSAEWLIFFALILTPMMHAWYFTWLIPFAVVTRNRGTIAATASVFVYFLLYHHVESPGGEWKLAAWETALLWLPLVAGFLYSARKPRGCHEL